MISPKVKELPRRLIPVDRDTFLKEIEEPPGLVARTAPDERRPR